MVFSVFTESYNHHDNQCYNILITLKEPLYCLAINPQCPQPPPCPWQPPIYFLPLYGFPTLDITCKWSHTIFSLLWLASFTQHDVFRVYPCCTITPLIFVAKYYSIVWIEHILFLHSAIDGHMGCFHFLLLCCREHLCASLGVYTYSRTDWSDSNSMFNFLSNFHTVFQSIYIIVACSTGVGKSRLTVVSIPNTEFILVLLFIY